MGIFFFIFDGMGSNQFLKGTLQTIILKLLEDNQRMYGYQISQKVKEVTEGGIVLTEAALYAALHKMEADGLLETMTEIADNNRVRKYYSLTEEGGNEVISQVREAQIFMEQLNLLLNLKPHRI